MPVKKILIIDDSPTERYILTEILNRSGYQVITAENGEESEHLLHGTIRDVCII